ncbi:MAG: hypothetical protein KIH64_013330 [Mycobacterium sp.]|nr:hypothetical protein [Mycobacterium sp.]
MYEVLFTNSVVYRTPSIDSVMSGAPAAVLTRTVNAAEVGNVKVVDADPVPLNVSA